MKKIRSSVNNNCIISQTSCNDWNGGDIEYLGICDGDPLNDVIWEIVGKLQDIAGEDLSSFDLDTLLDICNQKAPTEVNLLSILNILKNNQVCLSDYITTLQETINSLAQESNVTVNLKCFADIDNLGNILAISRDQLDQLVIDNLCAHLQRIEYLEGRVTSLQSQIDIISNDTSINEQVISTCIDPVIKPVSSQVTSIATRLCTLENSFDNLLTDFNALSVTVTSIDARVTFMEENCCASTCDDVTLGFSALFNEDSTALIIRFTWGAGTSIPAGFIDKGSTGTITDVDNNVTSFSLDIVDNNTNDNETEVIISGMNLAGELLINITAKVGTDTLNCEKCLSKTVRGSNCGICTVCTSGDGTLTIVYTSSTLGVAVEGSTSTSTSTTTTTSSSTTTTTTAP